MRPMRASFCAPIFIKFSNSTAISFPCNGHVLPPRAVFLCLALIYSVLDNTTISSYPRSLLFLSTLDDSFLLWRIVSASVCCNEIFFSRLRVSLLLMRFCFLGVLHFPLSSASREFYPSISFFLRAFIFFDLTKLLIISPRGRNYYFLFIFCAPFFLILF